MLSKLKSKLNIGTLLQIKAETQNLIIVDETRNANEIYYIKWAINAAAVKQLLVD